MQNVVLSTVLCGIFADVKQNKYFLIVGETTDVSTNEQLCICLRHVDLNLQVSEDFIGMYETDKTYDQTIAVLVKDARIRCDLRVQHCRGQCYYGAANMAGKLNGIAALISKENPKAV